jgi:hypothetical protein
LSVRLFELRFIHLLHLGLDTDNRIKLLFQVFESGIGIV